MMEKTVDYIIAPRTQYCVSIICGQQLHHQPPRMTTIPPRLFDLSDVIKSLIRDSDEKKR